MKYRVYISFRHGILDPEAEAIRKTVHSAGFKNISKLSKGKFFDIELKNNSKKEIEKLSEKILSNPIIEEYEIEKIK
tara:strand:+ start:1280 stop:1510 length:231 start_codon:yes stop_codon:yes gene_type:complete